MTALLGDRHLATFGISGINEKLTDKGNKLPNGLDTLQRWQVALFAEDEWSITDDFTLTSGARITRDENYGNHITPRLYGVWHTSEQWTLKGGISSGFRAPGLRQAVADWGQVTGGTSDPSRGGMIEGNPNLKPEKSISEEVGIVWNNRDNLSTSLTFFNTEFKDRITNIRTCEDIEGIKLDKDKHVISGNCHIEGIEYLFTQKPINVNKANLRGIEATLNWQATDALRFSSNYTYSESEQKTGSNKGNPLNDTPRHMINGSVDYAVSEPLSLWTHANLRGRSEDSSLEETPSFTLVDTGANYKLSKNLNLGFAVYNLFDKQIGKDNGFNRVYDGRRYWLSISAEF